MKNELLKYAANLAALAKKHDDPYVTEVADELAEYASRLPEDSVSSSQNTNNEEDTGGGDHPPKPPGQP